MENCDWTWAEKRLLGIENITPLVSYEGFNKIPTILETTPFGFKCNGTAKIEVASGNKIRDDHSRIWYGTQLHCRCSSSNGIVKKIQLKWEKAIEWKRRKTNAILKRNIQ